MNSAVKASTNAIRDSDLDKELMDVLFAISVISRQLAKKINKNLIKTEGQSDEK